MRIMKPISALLLALALVCGFAVHANAAPSDDERAAELKVIQLVNDKRANAALDDLAENEVMAKEARKHSTHMLNVGSLDHDGFETRADNIAAADSGIDADKICEIVGSAGITNANLAAKRVFHAWYTHNAFKRCFMDQKGYTEQSIGVGVQFSGYRYYFTLLAAHDTTP